MTNMDERSKRLKSWYEKKVGPFSIEIWPTNRCNLKCAMCGTWANRRKLEGRGIRYDVNEEIKNEISEKKLINLVGEAKRIEVREFLITGGGEPFVRRNTTLTLMKEIKSGSMFGNLNTNGTLLKKEDLNEIVEIGWDMMMISVDGHDSKTHDAIRGSTGSFEKIKENLMYLKKSKKISRSDKPKIVFNTVLNNKIYDKIGKLIEFASRANCDDITFIPLIPYDQASKKIELNNHQKLKLEKNIDNLINISKKFEVKTNLNGLDLSVSSGQMDVTINDEIKNSPKDLTHSPCYEPFLHLLIKANGESTFCCMIENSPENIKEKSLKEIWFGNYLIRQRVNFVNKVITEECKYCVFPQFLRNRQIREELQK